MFDDNALVSVMLQVAKGMTKAMPQTASMPKQLLWSLGQIETPDGEEGRPQLQYDFRYTQPHLKTSFVMVIALDYNCICQDCKALQSGLLTRL